MKKAITFHQKEQLSKAEQLYKKILKADPYYVDALHFYGLLHFSRGQAKKATELILASIGLNPDYFDAYLNLGNIYFKSARLPDAKKCYEKALELNPDHAGVQTNFGIMLKCQQMFDESIKHLTAVTESSPTSGKAYLNLASTYKVSGDFEQALENYKKAAENNPQLIDAYRGIVLCSRYLGKPETAREAIESLGRNVKDSPMVPHMLAAWTGDDLPRRASDDYVRAAFDAYADSFESSLAKLGYMGPVLLGDALKEIFPTPSSNLVVLDGGCGTGLGHAYLKPYASKLIGMDLSQKMLDQARQKEDYNQLICASLETGIARYDGYFDLIASIDTLIYFGDLDQVLTVMHTALKSGGQLVFTLEYSEKTDSYELCQSGRYAHSEAYVSELLSSLAYTVSSVRHCVVRKELGEDVKGLLVVAQK